MQIDQRSVDSPLELYSLRPEQDRWSRARLVLVCLAILIGFARPALATITLSSTTATVSAGGTDFFNFPGNIQTVTDSSLFSSFNHTLNNVVHGHKGTELDESASQDTEITNDTGADTLTITSKGSFAIEHKAPNPQDRQNQTSFTTSSLTIQFCTDKPYGLTASGSTQIQGPTGNYKMFPFFDGEGGAALSTSGLLPPGIDFNLAVSVGAIPTDTASASGVLPTGCWEISAQIGSGGTNEVGGGFTSPLTCKNNTGVCDPDPQAAAMNPAGPASGSYQIKFELGPTPPPGNIFPWVGVSGGGFGNPANWKPNNDIPSFVDGSRSDTALFQNLKTVTVDLSSSADRRPPPSLGTGACAGVITRSAGRLEVDNVASLEPLNGTLALDSISFDEPSLTVTNGGLLDLDQAAVCAQNAAIGTSGKTSVVTVTGSGLLQTLGRLSVGQTGGALLGVANGGVMQSEEVRIGDGSQAGTASVLNATWNTGDIAVGLESSGELTITKAGLMNSERAAIAFDLPPGPDPGLSSSSAGPCLNRTGTAGGVELSGTDSTWNTADFSIGALGCVDVTDHALLNNDQSLLGTNTLTMGGSNSGKARLLVGDGAVVKTHFLDVGEGGEAELDLSANGGAQMQVSGPMSIGSFSSSTGTGQVTIAGDPAISTDVLTADTISVGGKFGGADLALQAGARISSNSATVGVDGTGLVSLEGADGSTTWRIANPLTIGTSGTVLISKSTIDVVGTGSPGTVDNEGLMEGFGPDAIIALHKGLITNNGKIIGPITIDGNYDASSTGKLIGQISGLTKVSGKPAREAVASKGPPPPAQEPVVITGDADLSNTQVTLQFVNGFAPKKGDVIPGVQIQGTQSGTIGSIVTSGLAPGATFTIDPVSGNATAQTDAVAQPVVTIKGPTTIKESQTKGVKVQVSRKGDTSTAITVNYQVSGTATNGIDYGMLPGTVVIPAKKTSATFLILPYADGIFEPSETIELKLLAGDGYSVGLTSDTVIVLQNVDPKVKKPKKQ